MQSNYINFPSRWSRRFLFFFRKETQRNSCGPHRRRHLTSRWGELIAGGRAVIELWIFFLLLSRCLFLFSLVGVTCIVVEQLEIIFEYVKLVRLFFPTSVLPLYFEETKFFPEWIRREADKNLDTKRVFLCVWSKWGSELTTCFPFGEICCLEQSCRLAWQGGI